MIKFKQGDLITAFENNEVNVIAHCCNTCCGLNAGIAKTIATKYPIVKEVDLGFRNNGIGKCLPISVGDKIIFNLYGQKNVYYSSDETFNHRLKWITQAILRMLPFLKNDDKIGIPLILSGLAKDIRKVHTNDLDYFKQYVLPILEPLFVDFDVTVYYL